MSTQRSRSVRPKPIISRFFGIALAWLGAWAVGPPAIASASPPAAARRLTEAQAVKLALANPALTDLRAGWVGDATADGLERSTWQNPRFSYTREQLLGGDPLGEDYATLSQTFDISGRKRVARRAAKQRQEAAEHRADAVAADIAATTRHRYYRLLLAQQRRRMLRTWRSRVESHLAAVIKREQAGDAAAYDRLRLQRELSSIDARLQREDAAVAKAWALLEAMLDPEGSGSAATSAPTLDGQVRPETRYDAASAVEATQAAPQARARQAEARALALDRRAASRWWVPNPSLGAGYKGVEVPGGARIHGFVINLGIPLPVLDRGRGQRTRARSRAQTLRAETALATTEARAQATALTQEIARLSNAAQAMQQRNAEESEALISAAESGFRGGEISVMALVDAYRSSTEAELLALDLAMQARQAEIELQRRTETQS